MPKGVEHRYDFSYYFELSGVKIPMMPKGVEHTYRHAASISRRSSVKIPMMPKGVEHSARAGLWEG